MPDIEIEDNIVGSVVDSGNVEDNAVGVVGNDDNNIGVVGNDDNNIGNTGNVVGNDVASNNDVDIEDNNVNSGNDNTDVDIEDVNVASGNTNVEDNNVGNTNVEDNINDSVVGNDDNNIGSVVGNDNNDIDSNNTDVDVDVEDSGNTDSYNDTEVDIEDSGNTDSYNDTEVDVDVDITDSFNTTTLNDDSITVGVRQYNTGVGGDLNVASYIKGAAAAAAAGGAAGHFDLDIDNRATVVDQSVNQAINADDDVNQFFGQSAVVNSGDGGVAAGDDANVDNSVTEIETGDIWIGNEWNETTISDSFQDNSTNTEWELDVDIEDSFQDNSTHTDVEVEVEDAFNDYEFTNVENEFEWENSGNLFSPGGQAAGDDAFDF